MDIGDIKPNEDTLEIVHPRTKIKLGIRVGLISIDDERMKKIKRRINDERLRLERKGKGFNAEENDQNEKMLCFSAMLWWKWEKPELEPERVVDGKTIPAVYGDIPDFHGEQPTFNQAKVMQVFDELAWFYYQVREKVGEAESFFQK